MPYRTCINILYVQVSVQVLAETIDANQSSTPLHSTQHLIMYRQRLLQAVAQRLVTYIITYKTEL